MRIRQQQMDSFSPPVVRVFEDRMVVHLRQFFPEQCEALGDKGIREAIRHGIAKAESYRITSERDVCKYIDVMFAFGRDFDTDPDQAWAGTILRSPRLEPTPKVNRLYDEAMEKSLGGEP